MQRIVWLWIGIGSTLTLAAVLAGIGEGAGRRVGSGRAYAILGELLVQHQGRVKPLESMALEEIRQIHGRSTITLLDPDGRASSTWEPVAAVLDWSARPEFWDNQDFLLVEDSLLRRRLREAPARLRVRSLAEGEELTVREALQALAERPVLHESDLRTLARELGEASRAGRCLLALASEFREDRTWVSPRLLEEVRLPLGGQMLRFPRWAKMLRTEGEGDRRPGQEALPGRTPLEKAAIDLAENLSHYRALRDHEGPPIRSLDLLVVPRPHGARYFAYSAKAFEKGMEPDRRLSALETDAANTLVQFYQGLPSQDWALPGEDPVFDHNYASWLPHSSWLPLGLLLESDLPELSRLGLPEQEVRALIASYRALETAERSEPGRIPQGPAVALLAAARELGAMLGTKPDPDSIARETWLNRWAPLSRLPLIFGVSLGLLLASLLFSAGRVPASARWGVLFYWLGMVGLAIGTVVGVGGFFVRWRITRWGPVSHLYETVVWAALTASGLGLASELFRRRRLIALAAAGVAFLATSLAQNSPSLDPMLRPIPPVLRMNRWLVGHVLATVTGYGAFALVLGLGLLAIGHALTATYPRRPTYWELAWPLLIGIPLYLLGRLGVGSSPPRWLSAILGAGWQHGVSACLAAVGGLVSVVAGFSVLGKFANRSPRRVSALGVFLVVASTSARLAGLLAGQEAWFVGLVGGGLALLGVLATSAREAHERIDRLARIIDDAMLAGVVLLTAGTIVGAVWARDAWGRPWGWDPKASWALITILVYLVPLIAWFAGRLGASGLVAASVVGFLPVLMSWYVLNFKCRVGLHPYGFTEGGNPELVTACALALLGIIGSAAWLRSRSQISESN